MEPEKKSNGAFVGLIIIIIILVVGGVYIWLSNKKAAEKMQAGQAQYEAVTDQDAAALNSLEQDANGTDANASVDVNAVN